MLAGGGEASSAGFGENTDNEMCFNFAKPYPNGLRPARSSA
jgi:hypothetical protein